MHAGIVGAGLLGRLLAWRLVQQGWQVTLFDKNVRLGKGSAAYAAGGMLSPIAEQECAEPLIYQLGCDSLAYWRTWLPTLGPSVFFQHRGSILVAHTKDLLKLRHIVQRIKKRIGADKVSALNQQALQKLEPELAFQQAYYLPDEAHIDSRALLQALIESLNAQGVLLHFETEVTRVAPYSVAIQHDSFQFDWVFDCRGVGAQEVFPDLRAVRGELVYLKAPEVSLTRMIRFFHPRYRLYVIPRPHQMYLIGATEIESHDTSPISVRSCLELLSAAYAIHKGFAEARILETIAASRPAFPNNLPRLVYQPGLIAINGLYRHGFLIAPALVNEVLHLLEHGLSQLHYPNLVQEVLYDQYSV